MHVAGYPLLHGDFLHFLWGKRLQCNEHQGFAKLHPDHTVEKVVKFRPISTILRITYILWTMTNLQIRKVFYYHITLNPVEGMNSLQAKTVGAAMALSPIYETGQRSS